MPNPAASYDDEDPVPTAMVSEPYGSKKDLFDTGPYDPQLDDKSRKTGCCQGIKRGFRCNY